MGQFKQQIKNVFVFLVMSSQLYLSLLLTIYHGADGSNGIWLQNEQRHLCTPSEQRNVTSMMGQHNCVGRGPRDEVVRLALPNDSYADIIPNHVLVKRCGGSCSPSSNRHFSCLPASVGIKEVSVCLLPSGTEAGVRPVQCAIARVEEHFSCRCGCKVSQDACTRGSGMIGGPKRFIPAECKCECQNIDQRAPCLEEGNYWDDRACACFCKPQYEWPNCPSGYAFDHTPGTCACVSYNTNAAFVIDVLIIVVVLGLAKISFGLVQCYRSRTGFFRPNHHHHEAARNLFTQASTESTITTSGVPLLVTGEESPAPVRGATTVPQMTRIRTLIGQMWNPPNSSDDSNSEDQSRTNGDQTQEGSPILRNSYLYSALENSRNMSICSVMLREAENRQSFSTDISNVSSDR